VPSPSERAAASRPHISEWFGHRVFPTVAASPAALADQTQERCPFLSRTLRRHTQCIKNVNSRGVCTISATSNGTRQDWLVCPYRALDDTLLADMSRRLYDLPAATPVLIIPAITLKEPVARDEILAALRPDDPRHVFDIDQNPASAAHPAPIHPRLVIGTDARTLSRAAFDIAPAKALQAGAVTDAVLTTIARRLTTCAPGVDIVI
jgi:hypothetical protein